MSTTYVQEIPSPVGCLLLTWQDDALTGLYMPSPKRTPVAEPEWRRDSAVFADVVEQLEAYFAGQRRTFDVPVAAKGTAFQRRVWSALQEIPYGSTWTYRDVAVRIGAPAAVRAVGLANGRNPISIIVPCHRVIGANGSLTGYGGGLANKQVLLDLERRGAGDRTLLDQLVE